MNKNKNIFSLSIFGMGFSISTEDITLNNLWVVMWLAISVFIFSSCEHLPFMDEKIENPAPVVEEAIKNNQEVSKGIKENTTETINKANDIKDEARSIIDKVPEATKIKVQPNVDKIDANANDIIALQKDMQTMSLALDKTAAELTTAKNDYEKLAKQKAELLAINQEITEQLNDANNEATRTRNAYLTWLIIAGIIMLAVCGMAAARGETKAIWGAIGAAIVIVLSLAVSLYSMELAMYGAIGLAVAIAIGIYVAYKSYTEKKALKEVVHTMEATKEEMKEEEKMTIFGKGARPGVAFAIQSASTEKLVQEIRESKKKNWTATIS